MMGVPGSEPGNPARDVFLVDRVFGGEDARELRLLVQADEEMGCKPRTCKIGDHVPVPEQQGFPGDDREDAHIHGISDIAVKAADNEVFGRQGWDKGAMANGDESDDGFEQWYEPRGNQQSSSERQARRLTRRDTEVGDSPRKVAQHKRRAAQEGEEKRNSDVAAEVGHGQAIWGSPMPVAGGGGGGNRMSPSV